MWHKAKLQNTSDRLKYIPGGGGALNANYKQVDAVAIIAAKCGNMGLKYEEDFYWHGMYSDEPVFYFKDEKHITMLGLQT